MAVLVVGAGFAAINYGHQEKALPEETALSVVGKFYEYISEAKIRGGNLLINEAYQLTSGKPSRTDRARFLEVVNRYPPGFKVDIVDSQVQGRHANVTVEYKMASAFGGLYTVRTVVPLNVDDETNTWKIDFRGDTDDQDPAIIKKSLQPDTPAAPSSNSETVQ